MNNKIINIMGATAMVLLISCNRKPADEKPVEVSVPVTVTAIDTVAIQNFTDLNATTTYLIKNTIKANTTGYLDRVNVTSNNFVRQGQVLFLLKTREAKVLGNTINKIDPSLHFGNAITLKATTDGFVSAVNVLQNDYVQEGDALAVINDAKSFSIILSLPYAMKKYVMLNEILAVYLPDGSCVKARVENFMPDVDPASQTQGVVLKCIGSQNIPENLVVKVRIPITSGEKTISVPKSAVLSDETETDFWVMKMSGDSTAEKVMIKKGIETADRVEILSPKFSRKDRILLTGNYGVADTIKVRIVNPK